MNLRWKNTIKERKNNPMDYFTKKSFFTFFQVLVEPSSSLGMKSSIIFCHMHIKWTLYLENRVPLMVEEVGKEGLDLMLLDQPSLLHSRIRSIHVETPAKHGRNLLPRTKTQQAFKSSKLGVQSLVDMVTYCPWKKHKAYKGTFTM